MELKLNKPIPKRLCFATQTLALAFSALGFISLSGQAFPQSNPDLGRLVFDPVLIKIEQADDGSSIIIELTSLPSAQAESIPLADTENIRQEQIAQQAQVASDAISFALSVNQYEESIKALELEGGPYEERLSQEMLSLANIYQQQGDQELALTTFNQALHINRLNNGLFNLGQVPIIQEIIQSYLIAGDLQAANERQEYLMYIQRKSHQLGSLELLPALRAYADWNLLAFSIPLGIIPASNFANGAGSYPRADFENYMEFQTFLLSRLLNAQNSYRAISQTLLTYYGLNDRTILEVEQRLALTNYFFATNSSLSYNAYDGTTNFQSSMGYRYGREALQRRVQYLENMNNVSPEELAQAMLELGDWYTLFRKRSASLAQYEAAQQVLRANSSPEEQVDAMLRPNFPQPIPSFLSTLYTRGSKGIPKDIALNYRGYLDVQFTVNYYGLTGSIGVIGKTDNTPSAIESAILSEIRLGQFRPRLTHDNQLLRDDVYKIRYYYSY